MMVPPPPTVRALSAGWWSLQEDPRFGVWRRRRRAWQIVGLHEEAAHSWVTERGFDAVCFDTRAHAVAALRLALVEAPCPDATAGHRAQLREISPGHYMTANRIWHMRRGPDGWQICGVHERRAPPGRPVLRTLAGCLNYLQHAGLLDAHVEHDVRFWIVQRHRQLRARLDR